MPKPLSSLLLAIFFISLASTSCSGGKEIGEPCTSSSDCASEVCVGGGTCPKSGRTYAAFCAGISCNDQECPEGQECIPVAGDNSLKVCSPKGICD